MANMINVVVRDAESPEDDIVVPDTGWYTSSTESHNTSNFVAPIITTGAISFVVLLLLILAKRKYSLVDSFSIQTKKKWRTVKCLGILAILATFVTSMSLHSIVNKNATASDNLISITSSDTTITVVRGEEEQSSFGIATATIKLNESTPLGYNIYAYTPDGNILKPITTNPNNESNAENVANASNGSNTGNEANTGNESNTTDNVINPVSSNNSTLSNNTWGIALTNTEDIKPEDTIWNIVGDESNAILVASFDESTTPNTTITLRFGVLVDSTLPTGVYSANIEYKAYQRAYSITFNAGEGEITTPTKPVMIGEAIGELPVPTRTNYNFLGWYTEQTGGTKIDENTIPSQNSTYYAHWERITYNITFNPTEGTITTGDTEKTVPAGDTLGTLPEATRANYTFTGWYTEQTGGERVTTSTIPTGPATYYAHWSRDTYTITFNAGEGTIDPQDQEISINAGDPIGTLPNATRTNYTLAGWYTAETEGTIIDENTIPTGPTTYYAHWTRNEYTITFNLMGGNIAGDITNPTATVLAGNTLTTLPTEPTKTNYTFNGWWTEETDGTQVTAETRPDGTTTYYAHWTRNEYTITYNLMGGNISGDTTNPTATVLAGDTLTTLPTEPTKENYTFNGWWTEETDGTRIDEGTTPTGPTTYFAHWTRNEYTITYNLMGGNIAGGDTTNPTTTVQAGEALGTLPTEPIKTHHAFDGWFTEETDGTQVTTETVPEGNTTYYAHWTETIASCNPNATTIGTGNNTDAVCMQDVASMSEATIIGAVNGMTAETNYTLRDSRDDQDYTVAKLKDGKVWMTKNMNLPGKTKLYSNDSDVPSGYNKGEGASDNPYYTLPASSISGFNISNRAYVYNTGNMTDTCTTPGCYSYYSWLTTTAGGKDTSENAVADYHNAPYSICPAGWRLPTSTTSNAYPIDNNNWKTGDFYKLATAYGANLESDYRDSSPATGGNFNTNTGPTSTSPKFLFGGHYSDSTFYNEGFAGEYWSATHGTGNYSFIMYFSLSSVNSACAGGYRQGFSVRCILRNPAHTITFNANGGTVDGNNTTTRKVDIGSALGILPESTRTGYDFTGWFTEETDGTQITAETIPDGDTTYYAHWTLANPVVTFNTDGGSNVPSQTIAPGEKATRPTTNPTKSGYNFVDWYTDTNYNALFDFDTPINASTTVYARFVDSSYIAEMNGAVYTTVQSAADVAPSSQTTIRLLADTSEVITFESGQDIILDLNSKTLSYIGSGDNIIINKGTLALENGTVTSTGGKGLVENRSGATITTRNVNITITTTAPKQAINNNGGTAYILDGTNIETQSSSGGAIDNNNGGTMVIENARIVSTGTRQGVYNNNNSSLEIKGTTYIYAEPEVSTSNKRAAVQNVSGTLVISGGTIVSKDYAVTIQAGTFRLGTQNNTYDKTTPELRGGAYGIQSSVNYSVYDGIIEGKTAAVNDEAKITGKVSGYEKVNSTKSIDGATYQTLYYDIQTEYTITFNLNGGNINGSTTNPTATVQIGDALGTLPTEPTREGYTFDGWFTELNGGTKITTSTKPTDSRSYFAHWSRIEYTITYNLNGGNINGSTTNPTATVYAGDTLGSLPTEPTRTNYTFDGWFTAETDGEEVATGTIPTKTTTYFAHWTLVAVTFDDAYAAAGKTRDATSGKYTLQDMDDTICSAVSTSKASDYSDTQETQLVDLRDGKIYWVAKLLDGHCWMTQNLDLDLDSNTALVHASSDIGWGSDTSTMSWMPERSTISTSDISSTGVISGWANSYSDPYSVDTGDWYWIGNWLNNGTYTWYAPYSNNYLDIDGSGAGDKFSTNEYIGNGKHGHVGNSYNWSAAIASNDSSGYNTSTLTSIDNNPQNSICPAGWRLPTISDAADVDGSTNEFRRLATLYVNATGNDKALTASPLWFVRGGAVNGSSMTGQGQTGGYWSSTVYGREVAYRLSFNHSDVDSATASYRSREYGWSVRCVARDMSPTNLITFNANGGVVEGGSTTTRRIFASQALGALPTEPTREGYTFDGWYTGMSDGTEVTVSTQPTGDVTYYAHWTINTFTVSFDTDGGTDVTSQTITYGQKATRPSTDPAKEGYSFDDWYMTDEYSTKFDFTNNVIIGDTTIYAKFESLCKTFSTDSWSTIRDNLENDPSYYAVGCQKEVELDINNDATLESYTVRLANTSIPEVCNIEDYSRTACGFVIEFVDIVDSHVMNSYNENTGGWIATNMVLYLNSDFYNKLPSDLKDVIIPTYPIVSGSGSGNDSLNIISDDTNKNKIYLLSSKEVGLDSNYDNKRDTTTDTRTLDYYVINNSNKARKKGSPYGSAVYWWLRSAYSSNDSEFHYINSYGNGDHYYADKNTFGVAPAFRIGPIPNYKITFDANGGIVDGNNTVVREVSITDALSELPIATRDGHTFYGWYVGVADGVKITEQTVPTRSITYYAHWSEMPACNPAATTIGTGGNTDAVCMQDVVGMNETTLASAINNMIAETNYTLRDSRDDQNYTVAKLKDGKVWMTKNMNLSGETKLYSADSDVPSGYDKGEGDNDNPYYVLPVSTTAGFINDATKAFVYNSRSQDDICSERGCYSYYSWLVATVGGKNTSGSVVSADGYNAAYSICPAGWRLPTSTTSNGKVSSSSRWKTGDFYKLATAYGANLENSVSDSSSATGSNFNINAGPSTTVPKFLLGGSYLNSLYDGGSIYSGRSYYWSATSLSDSYSYALSFRLSEVRIGSSHRHAGNSVRCILR